LQPGAPDLDAATRVFSEKGFHGPLSRTLLVLQVSLMEQFIHTLPVKRMYCWILARLNESTEREQQLNPENVHDFRSFSWLICASV